MLLLAIAVLGMAILLVNLGLRSRLREQIIQRDAAVLNAIALTQECGDSSLPEIDNAFEDPLDDLAALLETTRFRPAHAVRIFDAQGSFVTAIPASATDAHLSPTELTNLVSRRSVHRYVPKTRLDTYLMDAGTNGVAQGDVPILEVLIPIPPDRPERMVGVAQFILDASAISSEFSALDRSLLRHGLLVFLLAGALISGAFSWAFWRLERANQLLKVQSSLLARAHQEATLSAKTAAVGAMTAHLMHGLKNPLSGLRQFVASHGRLSEGEQPLNWDDAISAAQHMQNLVNDIVRVLREENGLLHYTIELPELIEVISARIAPQLQATDVKFQTSLDGHCSLSNRESNLILLILENLLHNAIQATPAGKSVGLSVKKNARQLRFEVWDQGSGLPNNIRARVFTPCQSSKSTGSGIGLALSKQLASQLPAELDITRDTAEGCTFRLTLADSSLAHADGIAQGDLAP